MSLSRKFRKWVPVVAAMIAGGVLVWVLDGPSVQPGAPVEALRARLKASESKVAEGEAKVAEREAALAEHQARLAQAKQENERLNAQMAEAGNRSAGAAAVQKEFTNYKTDAALTIDRLTKGNADLTDRNRILDRALTSNSTFLAGMVREHAWYASPPNEISLYVHTDDGALDVSTAWLESLLHNQFREADMPLVPFTKDTKGKLFIMEVQFKQMQIRQEVICAYSLSLRVSANGLTIGGATGNSCIFENDVLGYAGTQSDFKTFIRSWLIEQADIAKARIHERLEANKKDFLLEKGQSDAATLRNQAIVLATVAEPEGAPATQPGTAAQGKPRDPFSVLDPPKPGPAAGPAGSDTVSGTGFIVSARPLIVTNHHVVKDRRVIMVQREGSDQQVPARVLAADPETDIAILTAAIGPVPTLPKLVRSRDLGLGSPVYTLGYPLGTAIGTSLKYTEGSVSAKAGPADEARLLQISAPILPGNSGGPLFSKDGTISGIIVSMLNQEYGLAVSGVIPTNIGYAIKSEYLFALMDAEGYGGDLTQGERTAVSIDSAKSLIVRITAQ